MILPLLLLPLGFLCHHIPILPQGLFIFLLRQSGLP